MLLERAIKEKTAAPTSQHGPSNTKEAPQPVPQRDSLLLIMRETRMVKNRQKRKENKNIDENYQIPTFSEFPKIFTREPRHEASAQHGATQQRTPGELQP